MREGEAVGVLADTERKLVFIHTMGEVNGEDTVGSISVGLNLVYAKHLAANVLNAIDAIEGEAFDTDETMDIKVEQPLQKVDCE